MNPAQATKPILLTMPGFDRFTYGTAMLRERFPSLMAPSNCFLEVLTTWVKERRFARSVGHDILAMLEDVKDKIGASVAIRYWISPSRFANFKLPCCRFR